MPPSVLTTLVRRSRAFGSLATPAAVLDQHGTISSVNDAWATFGVLNGADDRMLQVGSDYLAIWSDHGGAGDDVVVGLRALLDGTCRRYEAERWWPSPIADRWVLLRAAPIAEDDEQGVVVTHHDISWRKALERRLRDLPGLDPVAGLPDADHVAEILARIDAEPITAVVVELHGLAELAVASGRPAAERLLVEAIARVRRTVRQRDEVLRTGRWELAVVGPDLDPGSTAVLEGRLRSTLVQPYQLGPDQVEVGFGLGAQAVAVELGPDAALDEARAIALDRGLWLAPSKEGTTVDHRFLPTLRAPEHQPAADDGPEVDRERLDALIRRHLETEQAPVAYQAIFGFEDGAVVGAEALLRLTDDDGVVQSPKDVLAVADRAGLAPALGRLVLVAACREAARWQQALPERPLTVTVNLSAAQFRDRDIAELVGEALEVSGLEPARLGLEISEDCLVADPAWSVRQLAVLKMQGVHLIVDDYGTGSASLMQLRRFPLDALKVDLTLVAGLLDSSDDLAIVAATLGVAEAFGLRVVAKGVESEQQLVELRRLGCRYGQGFLWSSAVSGPDFLALALAGTVDGGPAVAPAGLGVGGSDIEELQLDSILRSLAHEVRTPLAVAMGYASLLESSPDEGTAQLATNIRRGMVRINQLLGNLEDVRLIDQGALDLEPRRIDLRTLVDVMVDELRSIVRIELQVEQAVSRPVLVDADELRVGQVLANLVTNAAKFATGTTPVRVRVDVRDDWAEVSVSDDGPGVDPADQGLIFRKYARADRNNQGSGLGLYLARGVARAHGGDVRYHRGEPGATFTLSLPRPGAGR